MHPQTLNLVDLVMALSDSIDLVSKNLVNHHKRVAYMADAVAAEMGLSCEERSRTMMAGAIHDLGALPLYESLDELLFDYTHPARHCDLGYKILRRFEPLHEIAELVRYHHTVWDNGAARTAEGSEIPAGSNILHLVDWVSRCVKEDRNILQQQDYLIEFVEQRSGNHFIPEAVNAFRSVARKESFWLDMCSPRINQHLYTQNRIAPLELQLEGVKQLGDLFAMLIDFRSRFTATHSSGVAASATELARLAGFSEQE